MDMEKIVQ
jgi:hypothetical protein